MFRSAFRAREHTYLRCGMPRNEPLWSAGANSKQTARQKLGLPPEKTVILYAPTWRDSTDGGKSYAICPPVHFEAWRKALGEGYVVLFRAHHQTTKVLGVKFDDFVLDVSGYPEVNDLMLASDLLITDYSAIAFDYSILCRPIFCYAYTLRWMNGTLTKAAAQKKNCWRGSRVWIVRRNVPTQSASGIDSSSTAPAPRRRVCAQSLGGKRGLKGGIVLENFVLGVFRV